MTGMDLQRIYLKLKTGKNANITEEETQHYSIQ